MRIVALRTITEKIGSGSTPRGGEDSYAQHGTPLIRSLNVYDDGFREEGLAFLTAQQANDLSSVTVESGDVLLNITGASVARCCLAPDRLLPARVNQHVCIIRPTKAVLDPHYLQHLLISGPTKRRLLRIGESGGATRQAITKADLQNLEIPLPVLQDQKRIAAVLDAADNLRAKRRESIEQLDSLVQATFLEMFGDPVANPRKWDLASLGEHASKVGSGATPKGGDSAYKNEGISLIRSLNVHDGDFRLDGLAFIDDAQAARLSNVEVSEHDVLLNITGASVARVCRAPRYVLPARVNQHVCIIRTKPTLNAYFLEKLLISPSMKRILLGIGEAGATRQAITKSQVLRLEIPLPPVELQARFGYFVQLVERQKDRLNKHLAQLEMLFVSLQSRAFSGELCSRTTSRQNASA